MKLSALSRQLLVMAFVAVFTACGLGYKWVAVEGNVAMLPGLLSLTFIGVLMLVMGLVVETIDRTLGEWKPLTLTLDGDNEATVQFAVGKRTATAMRHKARRRFR